MRVESAGEFRDLKSCLLEARCVHKLTADALLNEFTTSVARDRDATVELLIRLGAIDARQLYLAQACPSMYAYCTQVMRMSENSAFQRIRAARAARRFRDPGGTHQGAARVHLVHDRREPTADEPRSRSVGASSATCGRSTADRPARNGTGAHASTAATAT